MEVWLSLLISGILTAIAIVLGAIIGGYQLRRGIEEIGKAIERAVEAIHADIRHSQEKLERKMEK